MPLVAIRETSPCLHCGNNLSRSFAAMLWYVDARNLKSAVKNVARVTVLLKTPRESNWQSRRIPIPTKKT